MRGKLCSSGWKGRSRCVNIFNFETCHFKYMAFRGCLKFSLKRLKKKKTTQRVYFQECTRVPATDNTGHHRPAAGPGGPGPGPGGGRTCGGRGRRAGLEGRRPPTATGPAPRARPARRPRRLLGHAGPARPRPALSSDTQTDKVPTCRALRVHSLSCLVRSGAGLRAGLRGAGPRPPARRGDEAVKTHGY